MSKDQRYEVLCALLLRGTREEIGPYAHLLADHVYPVGDGYERLILTISHRDSNEQVLDLVPFLPVLPKVYRARRSGSAQETPRPQTIPPTGACSGSIPPAPPFPFDGYGTFSGRELSGRNDANEAWHMITHTLREERGRPNSPKIANNPSDLILPSDEPEAALYPNLFLPYGYLTDAFLARALENRLTDAEAAIWSKHLADQRNRLTQPNGTWATRYAALAESDAVFTVICEGLDETARNRATAERDVLLGFAETMVEGMTQNPAQIFHKNHDWEVYSFAAVYALTRLGDRSISPAEFETLTIWHMMCQPYRIGPEARVMETKDIGAFHLVEHGKFTEAAQRWVLPDLELDAARLSRLEAEASKLPPGERSFFTARWPEDNAAWPSIVKRFDILYSHAKFIRWGDASFYEYLRPCLDQADNDARIMAMPSGSLTTLIARLRHGDWARSPRRVLAFPSGRKILDDLAAGERSASLVHEPFLPFQRHAIADGHPSGALDLFGHDRRYHENMLSFFPPGFEGWVSRLVCAVQRVWDAEYAQSYEFNSQWQAMLWVMSDMNFPRARKNRRQGIPYTLADYICDLRPGSAELRTWTPFVVAEIVHEVAREPDFFGDNHEFTDGPVSDLLQSLYDALRDIYAAKETALRPLQVAVAIRRFTRLARQRHDLRNDASRRKWLEDIVDGPPENRLKRMASLRNEIAECECIVHFEQNREPLVVTILKTAWKSEEERTLAADMIRLLLERQTPSSDWVFRTDSFDYQVVANGWPELAPYCKNVTQSDFDSFTPLIAAVYQSLPVLEAFLASTNADICQASIAKWGPRVCHSGLTAILRTQKVEALAIVVRHLQSTSPSFLHALMERSVNSACKAAAGQHSPEVVKRAFDELFSSEFKTLLPALREHDPASAHWQRWGLATPTEPTAIALANQLGLPQTAEMLRQDVVLQKRDLAAPEDASKAARKTE